MEYFPGGGGVGESQMCKHCFLIMWIFENTHYTVHNTHALKKSATQIFIFKLVYKKS